MMIKPIFNVYILLFIFIALILGLALITYKQPKSRRSRWIVRIAVIILLGLISLRPNISGGSSQGGLTNIDVMYLVDTTSSMAAEDFEGQRTRLDGVKKDIENLTNHLAGARFSIITFDSKAALALPFTTDTSAVVSQASTFNQEITFYSVGSSIDKPLELAETQLKLQLTNRPERSRLVFYFGDGEQTAASAPKSFEPLKQLIESGAVLGYGTSSGGRMKEFSDFDTGSEVKYIKDYTTNAYPAIDAVSKTDESNLKMIASQLGVKYEYRKDNSDMAQFVKNFALEKLDKTTKDVTGSTDLYWLLILPLAGLMILDFFRVYKLLIDIRSGKQL